MAVPSYAVYVNDEGGVLPRNAIEVQFSYTCGEGGVPTHMGIQGVHAFRDHVDTWRHPDANCVQVARDHLNHFEIAVSEHHLEVRVTPISDDGTTFGAPEVMFSEDIELGFSRGWVHFTTHNHASLGRSSARSWFTVRTTRVAGAS